MEEDKFKDLLEDEELTALRLAALATKKENKQNLNKSESATAQPIGSIVTAPNTSSEVSSNQIPFVQSDRSVHNNYSWRKQNHSSRRRGGGSFPEKTQRVRRRGVIKIPLNSVKHSRYKKINHLNGIQGTSEMNHRSNLIVINPVTLNDRKDSEEKVPALVLPQHKWCNSGNEDSMSPKTLRRTGPTRFNRHGSDSESSDDESDYEPSDNDSGSNETVLQDEPPEHFSRLSSGCEDLSDSVEKKRRLSFQSLDSDIKSETFDKSEGTSVYKSLKNSLYTDTQQDRYTVQQHLNDGEQNFNSSDENERSNCNARYAYTTKSSAISDDLVFKQANTVIGKQESYSDNANASLNQLSDTTKLWQDTNINKNSACYSKDPKSSQVWQHTEGFRTDNYLYPVENQCISTNTKTYNDTTANSHYLTDSDLRLELKKRMQEMKSKTACIETNEINESRTYSQYNNSWDRNKQGYSHKDDEVNLSSANSFSDTRASSFKQKNRINQNFGGDNNVEHASSFDHQRSSRSNSRERTTQENFSNRDKHRFEYSFHGRRNDRSSSLDRNRRSSSRGRRRRDRSSSRDEERHERSSSQSRINHTNYDGRIESRLSPTRNKFEHSYKHTKVNACVSKERRDWYKSSPKEKPEWSSGADRSRHDCSSSSESKRERSSSRDRNKFLSSNLSHEKKHYENNLSRRRSRRVPDSRHDRNRRERSSSRDRSRHGSSRSVDSRSERSSSVEKHRRSSSREGSKDEQSSSDSESRYRYKSRNAYNASKLNSNQQTNKNDILLNQKTNIKTIESNQGIIQQCNSLQNKLKDTLNSGKVKDEESRKINTKCHPKSIEQKRSERSNSKEKLLSNRKPHQKYNRMKSSYTNRYSRSRSSSSESSSNSCSSNSSHEYKTTIRSVLVKSDTENKVNISENKSSGKSTISTVPQSSVLSVCTKRNFDNIESNKPSNVKCGRMDGDNKASEGKRVPVHMRLGAFPRKRVIQMPKDVEAAFVNSSSSDDGESINTKCKRQNIRIVTDMYDAKNRIDLIQQKYSSDKSTKRPFDSYTEKSKHVKKAHR